MAWSRPAKGQRQEGEMAIRALCSAARPLLSHRIRCHPHPPTRKTKINLRILRISGRKKVTTFYHAFHHGLTTNSPQITTQKAPQNSHTPNKNALSTTTGFFREKSAIQRRS